MKISARNVLKGKVKSVKVGIVNAEVVIQVAKGVEVVAMITADSVKRLGLKKGKEAFAVFKASSTMIAVPHSKRGQ